MLHSWTVEQFGDAERLALRQGMAALLGVAPARVTLMVEAASVRATAVISAPNRTVATSYVVVLAAQTPQSLSVAVGDHYNATSSLTVDALQGPIVLPATASPSRPALHNGSTATRDVAKAGSISPAVLSVIYAAVGTVALLGACACGRVVLAPLWCLRRRCRRLSEQRRKAEKAQQETRAVFLQARARALLAKRTLLRARAAKMAREAAATRVQIRLRRKLKLREIKREFKAMIETLRLEQAATILQRQVRTGLSPAVRRRNAEAIKIEIRSLAASIIQRQLRPVLAVRRSLLESLYRRARANWLKISRRLGRRHELAVRWRTLADAVLDAQMPSDIPLLEAVNGAWQVVWKFIGSPAALKVAPVTLSATQKQLLCRRRLDFLSGRPQPAQPSQAPEALEGESSHRPLTQNSALSLRSPHSPESSESAGLDGSRDLSPEVRTRPRMRELGSVAKQIVDGFGGAERRVKAAEVVAVEAFAAAAVGTAVKGTTATKGAAAAGMTSVARSFSVQGRISRVDVPPAAASASTSTRSGCSRSGVQQRPAVTEGVQPREQLSPGSASPGNGVLAQPRVAQPPVLPIPQLEPAFLAADHVHTDWPSSSGRHAYAGSARTDSGRLRAPTSGSRRVTSINNQGLLLQKQGKLDEAEPLLRKALEMSRATLGDRHPDTVTSFSNLGSVLQDQGKLKEAAPLLREALDALRATLGDRHPDTLAAMNNLGMLLYSQGNVDEAQPLLRESLETCRATLGDRHSDTLAAIDNLGSLLQDQGKLDEAAPLLRETLEASRAMLGSRHPETLAAMNNLRSLLQDQGKLDEAAPLLRETLEASRAMLGDGHPETLACMNNLGMLLYGQGNLKEAGPLLREALVAMRVTLGDRHPDTLAAMNNLGMLLKKQGHLEDAAPLFRELLEASRATLGDLHPDTLASIGNLASLLQSQGKLDEAEPLLREALDGRRATLGVRHPKTLAAMNNLGALLKKQGKLNEAEPLLREALQVLRSTLGNRHPGTLTSISNLASLLQDQGKPDEAEPLLREVQLEA